MNRSALTPPIAPSYRKPASDKATSIAASYVRPARAHDGDSDPDMDEALRRVQTELAYIEYADEYRREYREYVGEVAA